MKTKLRIAAAFAAAFSTATVAPLIARGEPAHDGKVVDVFDDDPATPAGWIEIADEDWAKAPSSHGGDLSATLAALRRMTPQELDETAVVADLVKEAVGHERSKRIRAALSLVHVAGR